MKYQNIVLTIIAVLLALHLAVKLFPVKQMTAGGGIQNVNICKIGGASQYGRTLEVKEVK